LGHRQLQRAISPRNINGKQQQTKRNGTIESLPTSHAQAHHQSPQQTALEQECRYSGTMAPAAIKQYIWGILTGVQIFLDYMLFMQEYVLSFGSFEVLAF
jgi:hypothetical protein